jgi:hypothetical protein
MRTLYPNLQRHGSERKIRGSDVLCLTKVVREVAEKWLGGF